MSVTDLIDFAKSKDIFSALESFNGLLEEWADRLNMNVAILLWAGVALSVIIGFFGYKLIKPIMALGFGYIGYFVGEGIFDLLSEHITQIPDWTVYVIGGVVAVLFMCLAFIKFSYAMFTVAAVFGYFIAFFYTQDSVLAIGGAFLLAMLSVLLIRTVFILLSSFVCGITTVSLLSHIFPKASLLQLGNNQWMAICLTIGIALLFAVVQFVINRHAGEEVEE